MKAFKSWSIVTIVDLFACLLNVTLRVRMNSSGIRPKFHVIAPVLLSIFIASCGGGGSSSGTAETVSPVDSRSTAVLAVSSAKLTTVSSGAFGDIQVNGDAISFDKVAEAALIAAYDENDQIIFLSTAHPGDDQIDLNADSTVHALLNLVPDIALAESQHPGTYENSIVSLQSVIALTDYIAADAGWSLPTPIFSDLFTTAIQDAISALNTVSTSSVSTASSSTRRSPSQAKIFSPQKVFIDQAIQEGVAEYSHEKTGVRVTVSSEGGDTFDVELANTYKRWVVAIIGEDPAGNGGNLEIDTGLKTFLLPGGGGSGNTPIPLSIFEQNLTNYGVYAYGPAFGDLSSIPSSGQAQSAYWLATSYTVLFEAAIPVFGKTTGSEGCLRTMFIPTGVAGAAVKDIATSEELRDSLRQGQYSSATAEVAIAMSNAISGIGTSCLAEAGIKLAAKLVPFVGHVKLALDVLDTTATLVNLGLELNNGQSQAYWHIANSLEQEFYMVGKDFIPAPTFGGPHYHTLEALNSTDPYWIDLYTYWKSRLYSGSCPTGVDDYTCEAYTFNSVGPYVMSFELKCREPVTRGALIDCHRVEFLGGDAFLGKEVFADPDGVIRFTHEYTLPGEYEGRAEVYDEDGGKSLHRFHVQIKRPGIWGQDSWGQAKFGL